MMMQKMNSKVPPPPANNATPLNRELKPSTDVAVSADVVVERVPVLQLPEEALNMSINAAATLGVLMRSA